MTEEDIRKVLEEDALSLELAISYLNIYVGQTNWPHFIMQLLNTVRKKNSDYSKAMQEALCCAILLPYYDHSTYIDSEHPENLLLKIPWYHQLGTKSWFLEFQKIVKRDQDINRWRKQSWSLGVIDPIEFSPNTRQAFNWLYMKAEESGAVTPESKEEIIYRFKNLVYAYGGAVICGVFTRHDDAIKKVVNWRSGYFFERLIFDVYTIDQVQKIKKRELDSASEKLVKRVRAKNE